jgi:hypothetical protein
MTTNLIDYSLNKIPLKKDWGFYILPFDLPNENFGEFEPIIKLYRSKILPIKNTKIPTWKCFNFSDFIGWHHYIALSEVDCENYMPRFRIMPTGIIKIIEKDFTGGTLDSIIENATREDIQTYIKELMSGPHFGLASGSLTVKSGATNFIRSLYLPLTLNGEKVEQFIHVISVNHTQKKSVL